MKYLRRGSGYYIDVGSADLGSRRSVAGSRRAFDIAELEAAFEGR